MEEQVQDTIEAIRASLQSHGGDVELVGIDDDNTVKVRLQGACQGCPGATMTMKMGIERILKERVPEVKEVIAVD
jgi:Fe-S cluster biogenesis protein NfuA